MYKETIGLVGGFGAYATLDFYRRILEAFSTGKERDFPHIIMDNDFTMPSRTRALLYGDDYDQVVTMISSSIKKLCDMGADHIVLVCGTAHAFLPDVFKICTVRKEKVLNIIQILGDYMQNNNLDEALLIAAEGTLQKRVYEGILSDRAKLINPGESNYTQIRSFIESVKTNTISRDTYYEWIGFLEKFNRKVVVLGCTEFPVLIHVLEQYDEKQLLKEYVFLDPLEITLKKMKTIIK